MLPIPNIWMIKLFTNRQQIRLLNSKSNDLDWYCATHSWKLKLLTRDLLFTTFVKPPPPQAPSMGLWVCLGRGGAVLKSLKDFWSLHRQFNAKLQLARHLKNPRNKFRDSSKHQDKHCWSILVIYLKRVVLKKRIEKH